MFTLISKALGGACDKAQPMTLREIVEMLSLSGLFEPLEPAGEIWGQADEPLTSYEAKYMKQGRVALRAAFRRNARPAPPPEPWIARKPRAEPLGERLLLPRIRKREP